MIAAQSGGARLRRALIKNAESVLSFSLGLAQLGCAYPRYQLSILRLYAADVASPDHVGTSASEFAVTSQLKIPNLKFLIEGNPLKATKGKSRVLTPLPPVPPCPMPRTPSLLSKTPYFHTFNPHLPFNFGSQFAPKNTRFMTHFRHLNLSLTFSAQRTASKSIPAYPQLKRSRRVKASHGFFAQKNSQFFIGAFSQNRLEIAPKPPKKPCKFAPKTMPITMCYKFINKSQKFCFRSCQPRRLHFFLWPLTFLIHSFPPFAILPLYEP
jgi:hypothetical protein